MIWVRGLFLITYLATEGCTRQARAGCAYLTTPGIIPLTVALLFRSFSPHFGSTPVSHLISYTHHQGGHMNKKVWTGAVVVFILLSILDTFVNAVLLKSIYEETAHLWRSEADMKIWLFFVGYAFMAYFFTLIFSKGYEGKGAMEGVRYGTYVGLMVAVPMAYSTYAAMPVPYSLAMTWFICGMIEFIVAGVALSMVFGKQAAVTPVTTS